MSASIAPDGSERLTWVMTPIEPRFVNAACRLPKGLQIEAVITDVGKGSGSQFFGPGEVGSVQACSTYSQGNADSGIEFCNGAVFENVRGDVYPGPEDPLGAT